MNKRAFALGAVMILLGSLVAVALRSFAESSGRKLGEVAQPLRAALTGSTASPGIDATLAALGKEEALARLAAVA